MIENEVCDNRLEDKAHKKPVRTAADKGLRSGGPDIRDNTDV